MHLFFFFFFFDDMYNGRAYEIMATSFWLFVSSGLIRLNLELFRFVLIHGIPQVFLVMLIVMHWK